MTTVLAIHIGPELAHAAVDRDGRIDLVAAGDDSAGMPVVVHMAVDGSIGPLTVQAWRDCRANLGPPVCRRMLDDLDRQQEAEYRRLARADWAKKFLRGWLNHRIGNVDRARCAA